MSTIFFHPFLPVLPWGIRPSRSAHVKVKADVTCPPFYIWDASTSLRLLWKSQACFGHIYDFWGYLLC